MSEIIPISSDLPAVFSTAPEENDDLSAGITAGFGVVSFRGRIWRVKYKGEEHVITNSEGDPRASIEVVMLKAASILTKQYYAKQYEEGDDSEPDCFSSDGVRPDAGVPHKQADMCATCPKNVFGSKITDSGKKAKACSDTKRIAIVPYPDLQNEAFGGPMLLRVPPSALGDLAAYAQKLKSAGVPYYAVVTKLSFDLDASYPKIKFDYVKTVTNAEEAQTILSLRSSPEVEAVTSSVTVPTSSEGSTSEPAKAEPAPPAEPAAETASEAPQPATTEASPSTAEAAPQDIDALVASLLAND